MFLFWVIPFPYGGLGRADRNREVASNKYFLSGIVSLNSSHLASSWCQCRANQILPKKVT